MKVVGLTGGIATGKSTFASLCQEMGLGEVINADVIVHQLYEDPDVIQAVSERYGDDILTDGRVDRKVLGSRVFPVAEERHWLESLLHPRVLTSIQGILDTRKANAVGTGISIVEVPLLYEVDFPLERDIDVVVGCAPGTQLQRVQSRNRLDLKGAQERIASQLPISEKVRRADLVIWNEGSLTLLKRQAQLFADLIINLDS